MRDWAKSAPRLASTTILLLFLSTLVPVWAALAPGEPTIAPKIIDGVLVLLLFTAFALFHRARDEVTVEHKAESFEICKWLSALPLLLFALYVLGARLKWDVLLIGLGWRTWYFVTILPLILASRRRRVA
jgi:hypothetical protein